MDEYLEAVLIISIPVGLVFRLSVIGSCSRFNRLELGNLSELGG